MLPEFLAPEGPDDQWYKVIPPGGIFKGEYVWANRVTGVLRGIVTMSAPAYLLCVDRQELNIG
jgi:hypothetical protein